MALQALGRLASASGTQVQDEVSHPMVHRLAGIYNPTSSSDACAQKLVKILDDGGLSGAIMETTGSVISHMVSPVRVLNVLHSRFPDGFRTILGLNEEVLGDFWNRFLPSVASDGFPHHPALRGLAPQAWRRVVPVCIHEDAGPYVKHRSVNIIFFSSLVAAGGEKVGKLPIAS